jgi:UDP-N-acetylglucosamine:LPS N-acetylglucosamine transferase
MKVLAIASGGGHWVQLLRLLPCFDDTDVSFMSTRPNFADNVSGKKFFLVPDASRWNKLRLIKLAINVGKIILAERPDVIVTTGASPGLMGIIAGRVIGSKTIWIDSMANIEKISLSGKIAVFFADKVFTQWPHLSTPKINYCGNVLE